MCSVFQENVSTNPEDKGNPHSFCLSQRLQWTPFNADILPLLKPGRYQLRGKPLITPHVSTIAQCSTEDQQLFCLVDQMERNILLSAIHTKLKQLNKNYKTSRVTMNIEACQFPTTGDTLTILRTGFTTTKLQLLLELGHLLEMGYAQIYVGVKKNRQKLFSNQISNKKIISSPSSIFFRRLNPKSR